MVLKKQPGESELDFKKRIQQERGQVSQPAPAADMSFIEKLKFAVQVGGAKGIDLFNEFIGPGRGLTGTITGKLLDPLAAQESARRKEVTESELDVLSGGSPEPGLKRNLAESQVNQFRDENDMLVIIIGEGSDKEEKFVLNEAEEREMFPGSFHGGKGTRRTAEGGFSSPKLQRLFELRQEVSAEGGRETATTVGALGGLEGIGQVPEELTPEQDAWLKENTGLTWRELKNMAPEALAATLGTLAAKFGGKLGLATGLPTVAFSVIKAFDEYTHQSTVSAKLGKGIRTTADTEIDKMIMNVESGNAQDPQTANEYIENYNLYWYSIFREWRAMKKVQQSSTADWDEDAIREKGRLDEIIKNKADKDREFFQAFIIGKQAAGPGAQLAPLPEGTTPGVEEIPGRAVP